MIALITVAAAASVVVAAAESEDEPNDGQEDAQEITHGEEVTGELTSDDVDVHNGDLDLNGNNIRNVGGSESAGSGAIRLANSATMTAESSGGNAIELLKADSSDNVTLGRGTPNNANTVTVQGPNSDDNLKFGGSPGAKLNASGDLELDFDADNSGDTSDSLNVVGSNGTSDVTYFQVKNDGTVTVNNGNLNLSSNGSIQASSTDHVQFGGSGTVTVPNGNLDAQGGTVENTTGGLTLDASGSVSVTSSALTRKTQTVSSQTNLSSEE